MNKFSTRLFLTLFLFALAAAAILLTRIGGTSVSAQSETKRYVVIYHQQSSVPKTADDRVARVGGQVLTHLSEIGALVATSANPNFAAELANSDASVSDITEDVPVQMIPSPETMDVVALGDGPVEPPGDDTQTGPDPLYFIQWDKKRMRASNQGSYAVQPGRPDVVVAVLDTGAEMLPTPHQDISDPSTGTNFDVARSRSFFPVQPSPNGDPNVAAWDDKNGHGSWCLSAVGAPINARGIVGVAPRVRLVALKVLGDNGTGSFVSLAQALIYAGNQKFDVASMSLGGYLRRANQGSNVFIKLVQRAVNYARENGVTPIAALSNEGFNISDGDFMRDFMVVPAEIDGVIGISATGYFNLKASYSNYGVGKTDVSAPGGDGSVQTTPSLPGNGSVVGAWAKEHPVCGPAVPGRCYVFTSGTSMATPNAAGVAALIISQFGDFTLDNSNKLHMPPQRVESYMQQTANNQPCPEPREVTYFLASPPFPPNTPRPGVPANQRCQGDAGYNNFYGKGIVDALKAVTEAPGQ
ncbi:MAG TPA: S8 family serine peptidase [Pyrinomonadaceae bacterium]|jgi:subtilisin family serine protease